jgi:hypothetical protein
MTGIVRPLTSIIATVGLLVLAHAAALAADKKHTHHDGKALLGDKHKHDGTHVIHKHGDHTVSVVAKGGKVHGVKVQHAKKGELPVKKVKTNKKMVLADGVPEDVIPVQGAPSTDYVGYLYTDPYTGETYIVWFPADMVYDGTGGAVEYVYP